jgi:hypothetical protein
MIRYLETHLRYEVTVDGGGVSVGVNRTVVASFEASPPDTRRRWRTAPMESGDPTESS